MGLPARLAAVWIGLLMILSGCADAQPAGDRTPTAPTPIPAATLSTPAAGPSSGQPTKQPAAKPQRTSVTVVMNGDLLWHNTLWYSAKEDARRRGRGGYDFAPLLAGMKPVVASADLAICHEEVPLAAAAGPYRNYPLFSAPPQVVRAIKATGYDVCTTASNHAVDQGFAGVRRTLDDLDRAKIAHAGTARSNAESQRPTIFTTRQGIKIGIVAATFSLNGLPMPKGKPWAVHRLSTKELLESGTSCAGSRSRHRACCRPHRNRILHRRRTRSKSPLPVHLRRPPMLILCTCITRMSCSRGPS